MKLGTLLLVIGVAGAAPAKWISQSTALEQATTFATKRGFPVDGSRALVEDGPQDFAAFCRSHSRDLATPRVREALARRHFWVVYISPSKRGALGPDAWIFVDARAGGVLVSVFGR